MKIYCTFSTFLCQIASSVGFCFKAGVSRCPKLSTIKPWSCYPQVSFKNMVLSSRTIGSTAAILLSKRVGLYL